MFWQSLLCENIRDSDTASIFQDPEDLVEYSGFLSFGDKVDDTVRTDNVSDPVWECY
jgi:hypothetical protein